MTQRVKEILSWYSADSPGKLTNLVRLLNHGRSPGRSSTFMRRHRTKIERSRQRTAMVDTARKACL
jgi:hypothetical protein